MKDPTDDPGYFNAQEFEQDFVTCLEMMADHNLSYYEARDKAKKELAISYADDQP